MSLTWEDGQLRLVGLPRGSLRQAYLFFLLFVPALMGLFALQERSAKRERLRSQVRA